MISISGALNSQFFLESDNVVSQRTLQTIDKATSSMMENGFYRFYISIASFTQQLIEREYLEQNEEEFQALTVDQLKRPLMLLFALFGVSVIVFIIEHIISKWNSYVRRSGD